MVKQAPERCGGAGFGVGDPEAILLSRQHGGFAERGRIVADQQLGQIRLGRAIDVQAAEHQQPAIVEGLTQLPMGCGIHLTVILKALDLCAESIAEIANLQRTHMLSLPSLDVVGCLPGDGHAPDTSAGAVLAYFEFADIDGQAEIGEASKQRFQHDP